ncbi:MAG: SpoIIE family protein phosphatase [Nocardia sp.]|nr:SpoIIE family protein phosphatase [Nocardia sp.]
MSEVLAAFRRDYAGALAQHLEAPTQATLDEGYELGRRALVEGVSILDLTEHHFRLLDEQGLIGPTMGAPVDSATTARARAALEFLLQTLAALDVATRGFLDSTRSYELQRVRAQDLADRDAFRAALVESLQDGFFVADAEGTITEVNSAFGALTGYGPATAPYPLPHPWTDSTDAGVTHPSMGTVAARFVMPVRHRDGRRIWLAVSTSSLRNPGDDETVYVGTIRDVTAEHDAQARDQAVSRLATAVGAATTVAEVLPVGLEELRRALGAETAVVSMWPNRQTTPELYVSGEVAEPGADSQAPETEAAASRQVIDARARALLDRTRLRPHRTMTAIPEGASSSEGIVAPLGEFGDAALWIRFAAPRAITADDWSLCSLLIGHLSVAVQRARNFDQARSTSLTLQRAMLGPIDLPPGFAVHYEPALPPLEIGGDWYDVVGLRDGMLGIVVGDCVGRGLSAAVVMGQLRTAAQALLLRGAGPAQLLSELDAVAARIPGAMCTTVCAAILDPVRGLIRYSSAGHMPPVLAAPGRTGRLLDGGRAVPLATFDVPRRPEATTAIEPGSTLVLFTDGLVEQRGIDIDIRFEQLADELAGVAPYPPHAVADAVLSRLRPDIGYDDDIAMVVYRQPPSPLRMDIPAEPLRLAPLRRELTSWLAAAAVDDELAADLVSAANEACTNSIEHAYPPGSCGGVVVTAECARGRVTIDVVDNGVWRPQPADPGTRGRGLAMMRALTSEVDIEHDDDGTRVRLTTTLPSVTFSAASRV